MVVWISGMDADVAYNIDVPGRSLQVPQILNKAGIKSLFVSRMKEGFYNWYSPDGTKTLAVALGPSYSAGRTLFNTEKPLQAEELEKLFEAFEDAHLHAVSPRNLLMGAGGGDYSQAPKRVDYPAEFLEVWKKTYPKPKISFEQLL